MKKVYNKWWLWLIVAFLVLFISVYFGLSMFLVFYIISFFPWLVITKIITKNIGFRERNEPKLFIKLINHILPLLAFLTFITYFSKEWYALNSFTLILLSLIPIIGSILGFITFRNTRFKNTKSIIVFNWKSFGLIFVAIFFYWMFLSILSAGIGDAQGQIFLNFILNQTKYYLYLILAFLIPFNISCFFKKSSIKTALLILIIGAVIISNSNSYYGLFDYIYEKNKNNKILNKAIASDNLELCNDLPFKLKSFTGSKPIPYHSMCFSSINKHQFDSEDCNNISEDLKENCIYCMGYKFVPKKCVSLLKNKQILDIFKGKVI